MEPSGRVAAGQGELPPPLNDHRDAPWQADWSPRLAPRIIGPAACEGIADSVGPRVSNRRPHLGGDKKGAGDANQWSGPARRSLASCHAAGGSAPEVKLAAQSLVHQRFELLGRQAARVVPSSG